MRLFVFPGARELLRARWTSGSTLKRVMYGRAGFALLRQRLCWLLGMSVPKRATM